MARKNLGTKITDQIKQLDYVYERIIKNIKVLKEIEQHSYSTELDRLITQQNLSFLKPEEIIEDKIDSTASNLEKYYSGVEKIFESIAVEIDDYLPNKGGWHQQLLEQMSKPFENKRDAVISRQAYQELSGFKEFRNFERHNYLRSIDPKVVIDSVENSFSLLHKPLIAEIETFITKLPLELQPGNEVNFKEKQAAASELNRNQYLHYKAQVSVRKTARTGLVGKIIQQEQEDIAIAQKILAEFPNLNIQAINKIKRIISQGDYAKKLKNTKDKKEINQYLNEIISKAQPMKKTNRSQENTLEQD